MKCRSCGNKVKEGTRFCPECGSEITGQKSEKKHKKTGSKKFKLVTTLIIILIISLVSFYFVGKNKFKPNNVVDAFEQAVKDDDVKKVKGLLEPYKDSFSITKENTTLFVDYLNQNSDKFNQLVDKLHQQSGNGFSIDGEDVQSYATVSLTKDGKKWVMFDNYELVVIPAYIQVSANQEDIDLSVNDKKLATTTEKDSEKKLGPFMPGTHTIKGTYHNKYVSTNKKEEMELFNTDQQTFEQYFEFDLNEVSAKINAQGGFHLFINDKETDIKKLDDAYTEVGTFPTDGSVKMHVEKEYPWGTSKSEVVTVDNGNVIFDEAYALTEEQRNDLMKQINGTISDYYNALNKKDVSKLPGDGVTDNLMKQLKKDIRGIKENEPKYNGKLLEIIYSKPSFVHSTFNDGLDAYTLTIETELKVHEPARYFEWVGGNLKKDNYVRPLEFTVFYNEDKQKWIVDRFGLEYFSISDHEGKVFEF